MELDDLRRAAAGLALEVIPSLHGLAERDEAQAAIRALGAARLMGWCVPERDGGHATGGLASADTVSVRALSALRDELSYHHGMLDVMFVMQGLGSYAVALGGSDELRATVFPDVISGEAIAAFALTEPGAGSSLNDVATRAERTASGWKLTGHKTFISNAGLARFYTLLARTSGEPGDKGGLSMFFVPHDAWGLETEPFEVMAPHPIGDVLLHDVELPAAFLLGKEGDGLQIALAVLVRFRASVAAAANGFARRALDESRERLTSREQFQKPLAHNQGLRFDLAEMDARLRGAQLLVDEAARLVDEGGDATAAVARAKLVATETAGWICDRAVQHHGGLGVKRGVLVERLYREVRALRIYEGTSEIQKLILAREVLARPLPTRSS
ncbi:MAG: acyl-CoA dehydrogenase family protein [Planctomycetota bacterium]